jgi:predicted nicotinamide N-methyase
MSRAPLPAGAGDAAPGALSGAALLADLERRFDTVSERVDVGTTHYDLLKPRDYDDLISEADYVQDERLPYWADIWPSSLVLAARLLEERGQGRRLLELGCGAGLVTLAAMQAGFEVTATDYYEDALHFTRANAWRALGREPAVRMVDWRTFPAGVNNFDVVVASDVLYERPYATLVAEAIERSLASHGTAIVADPGRIAAPDFLAAAPKCGLTLMDTEVRPLAIGEITQKISLYTIKHLFG